MIFEFISLTMFIKLVTFTFLFGLTISQEADQSWDLALAINNKILLLDCNGTEIKELTEQFNNLKALTFNNVRNQHFVSDMNQNNDTIYTISLDNETEIIPIVEDLPDDVQGLAIDTTNDILYWTDSFNKSINFVQLEKEFSQIQTLFKFVNESPQGIAVDSCNNKIYWTNSYIGKPTIESSSSNGRNRKILIDSDLFMPSGIAIDHFHQRIYWADMRQGIYFRIESVNFDGKERQVLYEGTHHKPYGLTIDKNFVFWTDINNKALWRKDIRNDDEPELLKEFQVTDKPMGLVARNLGFSSEPNCNLPHEHFAKEMNGNAEISLNSSTCNLSCVNGVLTKNCTCLCHKGFNGTRCETSTCYNFCNNGACHVNTLGIPQCHCRTGYVGQRCETNVCDNYCLNGGVCDYDTDSPWGTSCICREGFTGSRCETKNSPNPNVMTTMCALFCQNTSNDVYFDEKYSFICRCKNSSYIVIEQNNVTKTEYFIKENILNYLENPVFLLMLSLIILLAVVVFCLFGTIYRIKKTRPRIKKRIVVNKNITPLTYRPQSPIEQCEITIENCCNMNVCETPCFEPPALRNYQTKKDEKKVLLANMENSEDF